uniref:NAD(+) synthase n=1 Tax=Coprococcus catus TaxID=116085 RepID=UPI0022E20F86|nr:NAD(+) synthase [Coprococcus catus]
MSEFDAKKVKDEIIIWIRNWFNSNGKDCVAVVGISGGKDSSVVAALCVEALGKDRVFGVLMPQGKQKDIDYSYKLCNFLDIKHISVHIGITVNSLQNEIAISLKKPLSTQATTNLPARIRMTSLYAVAQTINGRVANTCNLSETLLSWETRWGDAVGDFSPLSDLTVEEVKAIGYELGLPECLIEKTPSDGLCGSSDEEALGFTYAVVDKYIRTGEIDDLDVKSKIDERVTKYRFKRLELPHYESGLKRYID